MVVGLGVLGICAMSSGCLYSGLSIAPAGHVVFHEASSSAATTRVDPRKAGAGGPEEVGTLPAGEAGEAVEAGESASASGDVVGPAAADPSTVAGAIPQVTLQGAFGVGALPVLAAEPAVALVGLLGEFGQQLGTSARGQRRGELVVDGVFGSTARRGGPEANGWNAVLRVGWRARVHRRVTLGTGLNTAFSSAYTWQPEFSIDPTAETYTRYERLRMVPDFEVATGGGIDQYEWSVVGRVGPGFGLYSSAGVPDGIVSITSFNQALVLSPRRRVLFPLGLHTEVATGVSTVAAFTVFAGVGFMGSLR